jgi:hypothetical protein
MRAKAKSILLAGAALLGSAVLLSSQTFAQDVYIVSGGLNFNGSGCLNDGVDATAQLFPIGSSRPTQFQILFSSYVAQQGPGLPTVLRQRYCNITVTIHVARGLQFSLADVAYYGFADLPNAGVVGVQRSTYQFPLHPGLAVFQTVIPGPANKNYSRTDTLGFSRRVWSPCGTEAPLTILSQVSLKGNPSLPAAMDVQTIDGRVKMLFGIAWRAC